MKAQNTTISKLAKSIRINRWRLGSIVNGRSNPRIGELEDICSALGLSVNISEPIAVDVAVLSLLTDSELLQSLRASGLWFVKSQ